MTDLLTRHTPRRTDEPLIDIVVKDEVFSVHKSVLTKHSEYFEACLSKPFAEAADKVVFFDDIEPRYLGYYLGLAASYSSIVPHSAPVPLQIPEARGRQVSMQDFVEVYKLCDRFISSEMGEFRIQCVKTSIGDADRALYHAGSDLAQQNITIREFADAFEALDLDHPAQAALGATMTVYFCEGIDYAAWDASVDGVMDRPRFVCQVSRGFARKLAAATSSRSKLKRKELPCP